MKSFNQKQKYKILNKKQKSFIKNHMKKGALIDPVFIFEIYKNKKGWKHCLHYCPCFSSVSGKINPIVKKQFEYIADNIFIYLPKLMREINSMNYNYKHKKLDYIG